MGFASRAHFSKTTRRASISSSARISSSTAATRTTIRAACGGRPAWPSPSSTAPTATSRRSPSRNLSLGATKLFGPTLLNDVRVGYLPRPQRHDRAVVRQGLGQHNWAFRTSVRCCCRRSVRHSRPGTGAAPALNTMYGLTVRRAFANSPRDHVVPRRLQQDRWERTLSKPGTKCCHFRANYFQLGKPSGIFQFDNMTSGLQPSGNPAPNTGNLLAGLELGYVRAGELHQLHQHLAAARHHSQPVLPGRLEGFEEPDAEPWSPVVHREPVPYRARPAQQLRPDRRRPGEREDGRDRPSHRRIEPRSLRELPAAHRPRLARPEKLVLPRRIRHQHSRHPIPERDCSSSTNIRRRSCSSSLPAIPRPLFQLSQGPAPVVYNLRPDSTATYVGTNFGSRSIYWMDGNLHPGYVDNWNATVRVPAQREQPVEVHVSGFGGRPSRRELERQRVPDRFRREQSGTAGRGVRRAPELSAVPAVRQHQLYVQHRPLELSCGHRAVRQALLPGCGAEHLLHILESARRLRFRFRHVQRTWRRSRIAISTKAAPATTALTSSSPMRPMSCPSARAATSSITISVLDFLIGGYEIAWVQTFEYRQSVRLQLHQQPVQLLPVEYRQLRPEPDLQRHFDAAVRAGQQDRRQPLQPGARESRAARELLRCARRRSRPAMPAATSSPARASCTRRPRRRRTSLSRNGGISSSASISRIRSTTRASTIRATRWISRIPNCSARSPATRPPPRSPVSRS